MIKQRLSQTLQRTSEKISRLTGSYRYAADSATGFLEAATITFLALLFFQPQEPWDIAVFVSSQEALGDTVESIKFFAEKRAAEINANGGVAGAPVRVRFLDDNSNVNALKENIKSTIDDPRLLAYIGCWNSTRGSAIAQTIGDSKIPFLGDFSATDVFQEYDNIYTLERSVDDELTVFKEFLKASPRRVSFFGIKGDLFSEAYLRATQELAHSEAEIEILSTSWYPKGTEFEKPVLQTLASSIPIDTNFLILSLGTGEDYQVIKHLRAIDVHTPAFTPLGDLGGVIERFEDGRDAGEMYDIAVVGIPNTYNLRMEELAKKYHDELLERRIGRASLGYAGRYADGIGLIAASAKNDTERSQRGADRDVASIRKRIISNLSKLSSGRKVYRGWAGDWSFTERRSNANSPLIAWKPAESPYHVLAERQFIASRDLLAPVLYLNIDLIKIDRVNDEEGSFYSDFFLELRSAEAISLEDRAIDFTNAFRSESDHRPLISFEVVDRRRPEGPNSMFYTLYKVSGKFAFEPNLQHYPFDRQQFYIALQPRTTLKPFIIQPPDARTRDLDFESPAWQPLEHFVGFDQDIITSIDDIGGGQRIIPYYKFKYAWLLERSGADYLLKVAIPLAIIVLTTYMSSYIKHANFEAKMAIQVTSLLASIALYLSVYKPANEHATISDSLFIFTYTLITAQMSLSIVRALPNFRRSPKSMLAIAVLQRAGYPLAVTAMTIYTMSIAL